MVEVFRDVRRVMREDATLWLNLGDSFASGKGTCHNPGGGFNSLTRHKALKGAQTYPTNRGNVSALHRVGLKPKDLVGIPWRLAFALQADGWYLRSDIIWHKPNPMPESVTDRPTKSHEYLFLLSKRPHYFYDAEAIKEPAQFWSGQAATFERDNHHSEVIPGQSHTQHRPQRESKKRGEFNGKTNALPGREAFRAIVPSRNRRDVWTIPTSPFKDAHFATFPPKLVGPCVLAGTSAKGVCPECGAPWERVTETGEVIPLRGNSTAGPKARSGERMGRLAAGLAESGHVPGVTPRTTTGWRPTCDHWGEPVPAVVLDPFCGSGTVGQVCRENGRRFVGLDLSWKYLHELAYARAELGQLALA